MSIKDMVLVAFAARTACLDACAAVRVGEKREDAAEEDRVDDAFNQADDAFHDQLREYFSSQLKEMFPGMDDAQVEYHLACVTNSL